VCGLKILIISSYFGPETSVGVLRVNAFAHYWARQGHQVHVLTMPFTGDMPIGIKDNPLIHVQQIAPWLMRGGKAGGGQAYSKGVKGWRRRLLSFQYWLKRRLFSNYLDPRVLWWPRAALAGRRLVREQNFDLLYSTVPSYTAHSSAACIKQASKQLFWVADYRDLWAGNPIFPGCVPVRAFERWHERKVLASADLICCATVRGVIHAAWSERVSGSAQRFRRS
jgi:Glycosyl transferase 4-like domain